MSLFRTSLWIWRHHGPPKRRYPTTTLHSVTTQKTSTWIAQENIWNFDRQWE